MEDSLLLNVPTIECTLNEILYRHRDACNADTYVVDYTRREVRIKDFQGQISVVAMDTVIDQTRQEARDKGYNLVILGGMYA